MKDGLKRLLSSSKALTAVSAIISMVIAKKCGVPLDWNKIVEYGLYIVLVYIGSVAAEDFAAKMKQGSSQ